MSELQQAADACGHLAKQYKGVLALAEAVGKIGNLDAHRAELEKRRDAAQVELENVVASLATAKTIGELEKAKEAAELALAKVQGQTENTQAALLDINAKRNAAEESVKALRVEAGEVEKKLGEMRADISAIKARYGQ
jgi:uncharacterized coiled-coil DUF342 family protein